MKGDIRKMTKIYDHGEVFAATLEYFGGDELATTVFVTKYALRDENDQLLERTPADMHRRLAKEFARIENKYPNPLSEQEIFDLLDNFRYVVPQGSPMSAMGNHAQVQSLSNCFAAGTMVHTVNRGPVPIEEVKIGDEVVTHLGRPRKVLQLHKNKTGSRQLYNLKAFRTPSFTVTDNHKILSLTKEQISWGMEKPTWNTVDKLRKGDYVAIPKWEGNDSIQSFDIASTPIPDDVGYTACVTDDEIELSITFEGGNGAHPTKRMRPLKRYWRIDEDFAFFVGLWLGDGCIFSTRTGDVKLAGITLTFHAKERKMAEWAMAYAERAFGLKSTLQDAERVDNSIQVRWNSPMLAYAFRHYFGQGFNKKRLHASFHSWPKCLVEKLIAGMLTADGTVTENGDVRLVLANKELVQDIYSLGRRCGMKLGLSKSERSSLSTEDVWRVDFPKRSRLLEHVRKVYADERVEKALLKEENGQFLLSSGGYDLVAIRNKQPCDEIHEFVYTIGVEEDHSYIVEGVIVENCFVISPPQDSYGSIARADEEILQIQKRRGGCGVDVSNIRPRTMKVANAARTSDGLGIFMERYSNTTREVAQGGRRGALMETSSVNHPDIETFVNIKQDKKKVTGANVSVRVTDEFMNAVEKDENFTLRWPVQATVEEAKCTKTIVARDLWKQMMHAAWASAEPGVLYWDTITRLSMADEFADKGYETVCTNPCFSGDTLIATADGRHAVSIKQLAEEGKDVDVYSVNTRDGIVSIKRGVNPRVTRENAKLVRVHLDDGTWLDTTPDHNFLTIDGEKIEAKDLKIGQSLPRFLKRLEPVKQGGNDYVRVSTNTRDSSKGKIFEHRLVAERAYPERWAELYNVEKQSGWVKGGLVVHHKDRDPQNNAPGNLEVMTWSDHTKLHAEQDNQGENNSRYIDVSNEEVEQHAIELTTMLGRRFSRKEWITYALDNQLPVHFGDFRVAALGTVVEMATRIAKELCYEHADVDPRLVRTLHDMEEQGYDARIDGHRVLVKKVCEHCSSEFEVDHHKRQFWYCSQPCALSKINSDKAFHEKRTAKTVETYAKRSVSLRNDQARVWSELKFNLQREPMLKEWEAECQAQGIARRLKTKFGFQSWKEISQAGQDYNHKVVRVEELPGEHTVYNLTVEDNHTVAIVTKMGDPTTKTLCDGVIVAQCSELPLSKYDSCRLLLLNLFSYVKDPYTANASFDHALFAEHVVKAQRLMDDLVDLELEAIDRILAKIASDPESEDEKSRELNLWKKVRKACNDGRRTGTGITALGDALAALGLTYGSRESITTTEDIYRMLALNAHASSVIMATERGSFPAWEPGRYKSNEFAKRLTEHSDQAINEAFTKYGRRNIALTTTAPAGSVSTLTRTTSGIEPAYLLHYKRRKKLVQSEIDRGAPVDFVDQTGDKWQEYDVYHHGLKMWMDVTGEKDIEKSPYHKATSADVDWVASVDLLAAAQKWTEHSISKTINLPSNTTEELVSEVYMRAWKLGIKGVTVYRDGSRDNVLSSVTEEKDKKEKKQTFEQTQAIKRPKQLECEIHRMSLKGEKYVVLVGMFEGNPYEVFVGASDKIELPKRFKTGFLTKNKRNKQGDTTYDLTISEDGEDLVFKDVANLFDNKLHGSFTRIVSLSMRHGVPVQFVCEQLVKSPDEDMQSFARVLSRVLKTYIKDGNKPASQKSCENCGSENLYYSEGCVTCASCSSSKCS